tara:strand:+ start:75 stop:518 length:444 start_codon:yes stop_codon:yes gene_type:complete
MAGHMAPIISLAVAIWCSYLLFDYSFFSYHPVLMVAAVLAFSLPAVALQRATHNVTIHIVLQVVGLACMVGGMYVIYLCKEEKNRPHWYVALNLSCQTYSPLLSSYDYEFAHVSTLVISIALCKRVGKGILARDDSKVSILQVDKEC